MHPLLHNCLRPWIVLGVLALFMANATLRAEDREQHPREQITMTQATGPVRVDGHLDEPDWTRARPAAQFRQHAPVPGGEYRGSFQVRVLQDARALYLGVTVIDDSTQPPATLAPRDAVPDRRFQLMLSSTGDLHSGLVIGVNALGRQQDFLWDKGAWRLEHNVRFTSAGRETERGCEIELEIPFRSLSYPLGEEQTWQVLYLAEDPAKGLYYSYPNVSDSAWFGDEQLLRRFSADLTGVRPTPPSIGVAVTGTLTGVQTAQPDQSGALAWTGLDPWYDALRPGAQVDVTFTPNLTLSVVGNPDFSDVESDIVQFDLNARFNWERGERRDFFIRDTQLFGDELMTLYTRSMVQPVYGLRAAGTVGSASFGVLQVIDRAPSYSLDWNGTPGWNQADVEGALASTTYARMKLQTPRADIGLLSVDKRLIGGADSLNSVNGMDLRLRVTPQLSVVAALQGSTTTDADQLARSGHRGLFSIAMPSSPGLRWKVDLLDISQDFRAESAFLPDTGLTRLAGYLERPIDFVGSVNRVMPRLGGYLRLDRDGEQWSHGEGSIEVTMEGVHKLKALVETNQLSLATASSPLLWNGTLTYVMNASGWLGCDLKAALGESWYWPTNVPSKGGVGQATVTIRPHHTLTLDGTWLGAVNTPDGGTTEWAMNLRWKGVWQFLPRANLRIIEESGASSSSGERWLSSSALLHFQARVGTEAWLGYQERRALSGAGGTEHTVFFKLSGDLRN